MKSGWMTVWRLIQIKRFGKDAVKMQEATQYNLKDITKESEEMQIEALKEAYEMS